MADLRFELKVGQEGLVTGIKVATKTTEEAAAAIKTALEQAAAAAKNAGKDIGDGLGKPTKDTGKGIESFTDKLKDFKQEQVSNARQARFFGTEIASIIPGAVGAQGALQSLINIAVEGSALGVFAETAKLGLGTLAGAFNESEARAKELRQVMRDTGAEITDSMRGVAREVEGSVSKIAGARRAFADKTTDEGRSALAQAQEYLRESHMVRDFLSSWFSGESSGIELDEVTGEWKNTGKKSGDSMVKSSGDVALEMFAKSDKRIEQFDASKPTIDAAKSKADLRQEEEVQQEIAALHASTRDEILRIEADKEQRLDELEHKGELDDEQFADKAVAINADAARRIEIIREERQVAINAKLTALESQFHDSIWRDEQALYVRVEALQLEQKKAGTAERVKQIQTEIDAETVAANKKIELAKRVEQESLDARRRTVVATRPGASQSESVFADLQNKVTAERSKLGPDATAEERARLNERINVLQQEATGRLQKIHASIASQFIDPLVSDWNNAINQMIEGTFKGFTSIGELLEDIGKSILKSIVGVAFKAIAEGLAALISSVTVVATAQKVAAASTTAGYIAEAAAGAAASQAYIPIVGPALATGAAAEMAAFLSGLTAPFLASASGGYDIGNVAPITQLHPKEMVLPARIAEPLRAALDRGAIGGGDHYHFHGTLIDKRSVLQLMDSPEWQSAAREQRRNGKEG
jgi:hypothetical protein